MSGNVIENDMGFEKSNPSLAVELISSPRVPKDARQLVEDRMEEKRLRRELLDYQYDF